MDVRTPDEGRYRFGPFLLDPAERSLTRDGAPVALTHRVFETLMVLVRNPGQMVSKDELMEAIWPGRYMEEGSLKQAIFTLRKALSGETDDTQYIVTAPGRGYSFMAAVERIAPIAKPQAKAQTESIGEPSNDLIYDRGLKHHDAHSSPKDSIGVKRKFMVSSDVVEARIAKGTLMCWVGESVGT